MTEMAPTRCFPEPRRAHHPRLHGSAGSGLPCFPQPARPPQRAPSPSPIQVRSEGASLSSPRASTELRLDASPCLRERGTPPRRRRGSFWIRRRFSCSSRAVRLGFRGGFTGEPSGTSPTAVQQDQRAIPPPLPASPILLGCRGAAAALGGALGGRHPRLEVPTGSSFCQLGGAPRAVRCSSVCG